MFFFLVVAKSFFYHSFFRRERVVNSRISLSKYSAFGIGGWSRRLTRLKSWDRMCHVKARQKHFFSKVHFSDWHRTIDLLRTSGFHCRFLVFQAYGTFKLFVCFQHKSHSATPDTFRDSAKNILGYCYICIGFELHLRSIVGLPGSCACLLRFALFG